MTLLNSIRWHEDALDFTFAFFAASRFAARREDCARVIPAVVSFHRTLETCQPLMLFVKYVSI